MGSAACPIVMPTRSPVARQPIKLVLQKLPSSQTDDGVPAAAIRTQPRSVAPMPPPRNTRMGSLVGVSVQVELLIRVFPKEKTILLH